MVAAHVARSGADVTVLTRSEASASAIERRGITVRGATSLDAVRVRAVSALSSGVTPFDAILLATQPPEVEAAARNVLAHLANSGALVCLQNGLCEERLAHIVSRERIVGAVVSWGATMLEPGIVERTSHGGFVVGRLDGKIDARLRDLARCFESVGPTAVTDNLLGARWSKLAVNCAVSSLGTIGGDRLGALLRKRFVRRLALETMSEAVEVARASGVTLEKVGGTIDIEWLALTKGERASRLGSPALVAKHSVLLAAGWRYRRLRSSMLRAIERGNPPAIEFLNGEVVERGRERGVATPVNAAVRDAVWRLAGGLEKPSLRALAALYESVACAR